MPSPYDNFKLAQSTAIREYAGAPIQEFSNLLQKKEKVYQTNVAEFDNLELLAADLDVNDSDYAVKKGLIDKVRENISSIEKNGGAYENATTQVRQLGKQFINNPGLKAALENQVAIRKGRAENEDKFSKGIISQLGYQEAKDKYNAYEGIGEGIDGIYNKPETYNPLKAIEIGKELTNFGRGWKEELKISNTINPATGQTGLYSQTTSRYISENEIEEGMLNYVKGDQALNAFVEEEARLSGLSMEEYLAPMLDAQKAKLGFNQIKTELKKLPGFDGSQNSSTENSIGRTQKVDIKPNSAYQEGSKGVKTQISTLSTSLVEATNRVNRYKQDPSSQAYKTAIREQESYQKEIIAYQDANEKIKHNLEVKYGKTLEDSSEYLVEAKKKASKLYSKKMGSMGTGMIGTSREDFIRDNYGSFLAELDPMWTEYEETIQSLGNVSSFDSPIYINPSSKENKELDDTYSRTIPSSLDLHFSSGPNQNIAYGEDAYELLAEGGNKISNGGVRIGPNGTPVALVNILNEEGGVVETAYHTDRKIITSLIRNLSTLEKQNLRTSGAIARAQKSPNRIAELSPILYDDDTRATRTLEIITPGLSFQKDVDTGMNYKITITEEDGEIRTSYSNNATDLTNKLNFR